MSYAPASYFHNLARQHSIPIIQDNPLIVHMNSISPGPPMSPQGTGPKGMSEFAIPITPKSSKFSEANPIDGRYQAYEKNLNINHDIDDNFDAKYLYKDVLPEFFKQDEGNYLCGHPGCGRKFNKIELLGNHAKNHYQGMGQDEDNYCDKCKIFFTSQDSLKAHFKTHFQEAKKELYNKESVFYKESLLFK